MKQKEAVSISFKDNFHLFPMYRLLKQHAKISMIIIGIQIFILIGDAIIYRELLQRC